MSTSTEEDAKTQAAAPAQEPNAKKKARVGAHGPHVRAKKGKLANKATRAKKAPKGAKKPRSARDGSKTASVLDLLKRSGGATMKELMKATGWQPHSVRGFLSGTIRKKMGLTVTSTNSDEGERSYLVNG